MIALITATGARVKQMALCAQYMARQTYAGPVAWFIIDDCQPRCSDCVPGNFRQNWSVHKIYPQPLWQPGQNTQGRNIKAGIDGLLAKYAGKDVEAVYIIEDDDYYKPEYLQKMQQLRGNAQLWGETHTVYYNVVSRTWWENQNAEWSSLFQTGLTMQALPYLQKLYGQKFIDYVLFRTYKGSVNLFRAGNLAIGIKGQPGRAGIGAGHKDLPNKDADCAVLRGFLGNDYTLYL